MKKLLLFAAAVAGLLVTACKEEAPEYLELTSSEIQVPVEGVVTPISFTATSAWTVSSDVDWVSFDQTEGEAGDVVVKLTVAANEGYDTRTATVTITSASNQSVIKVSQAGTEEFAITVVKDIDASAQVIEFEITSNVEYSFKIAEDATWITNVASKAAPVESVLKFNVASNTGLFPREGKIFVSAADAVTCFVVRQKANFEPMSLSSVTYLGNSQYFFDYENWCYTTFDEYLLTLVSEKGVQVDLAINAPVQEDALVGVPVGSYEIDLAAVHADNTFSIKPTDGSEKYYTRIVSNNAEIDVFDGEITLSKEGDVYTITAVLIDAAGNENRYSCQSQIGEIADDSFTSKGSTTFRNNYYTYFASGANEWDVTLSLNKAPYAGVPFVTSISFVLVGSNGEVVPDELPVGTFTLAFPEYKSDLTYNNGTLDAKTGTFRDISVYDVDGHGIEVKEGSTITVTKNSDGTYDFALNLSCEYYPPYEWEDPFEPEFPTFNYTPTISGVNANITESPYRPILDGDFEFTNAGYSPVYIGYWFGNKWNIDNCSAVWFGWNLPLDDAYSVSLAVNFEGWTFEKNFKNYCNTPFPEGRMTFSETPGPNTIIPLWYGKNSPRCTVTNAYTGTVMLICGGYIDITTADVTFNIEAKVYNGTDVYKFTGTVPSSLYYVRDHSSAAANYILESER